MVAQSVDIEAKLVTTIWFSDAHESQIAVFPASALDRFEASAAPAKKAAGKAPTAKKPGRKAK
jgi:hypothetical protein